MPDTCTPPSVLPRHIEQTIQSIAQLHADHHQNTTQVQRGLEQLTALVGRPLFIGVLTVVLVAWIGSNVFATAVGFRALDPPPFVWLAGIVSVISLYVVVLVLATQRRADELSQRRDQLTLELAVLSEQKATKIIQLLEESRRDNPLIHDRLDQQADDMARPSNPQTVLTAIAETHAEAEQPKAISPQR